jgi:hypothetical protein
MVTIVGGPVYGNHSCDLFPAELPWNERGNNLFTQLRSNNPHFWAWARSWGSHIPNHLAQQGVIAGDPHRLNYRIILVDGELRFLLTDLDDVGRGPWILDFTRFAITVKAEHLGLSTGELFAEYRKGLEGKKVKKPKFLKKVLKMSKKEFEEEQEKYIRKVTKDDKFDFDGSEFFPLKQASLDTKKLYNDSLPYFERALKGFEILDTIVRIKDSGGSAKIRRFLFLVRDGDGQKMIFEFKEQGEPGPAQYAEQKDFEDRLNDAFKTFWKDPDSSFRPVIAGKNNFYMRPRFADLDPVPQVVKSEKDKEHARDLNLYIAYYMGKSVHRQRGSVSYLDGINSDPDAALDFVENLMREYLKP